MPKRKNPVERDPPKTKKAKSGGDGRAEALLNAALGIACGYVPVIETKRRAVEAALDAGHSVCIVGPVGSGKTTLARAVLRNRPHIPTEPFESSLGPVSNAPSTVAFPSLLAHRSNQLLFVDDVEAYPPRLLSSIMHFAPQVLLTALRDARLPGVVVVELKAMSPTNVRKILEHVNVHPTVMGGDDGDARIALWSHWEERMFGAFDVVGMREQRGVHMLHAIGRVLFPRKAPAWPAIISDPTMCTSPLFHGYLYHNAAPFLVDLAEAAVVAETFSRFACHPAMEDVSLPALSLWSLVGSRPSRKVPFGFSKPPDCFLVKEGHVNRRDGHVIDGHVKDRKDGHVIDEHLKEGHVKDGH